MFGFSITINGDVPAKEGDISYKNIVCSNHMIKKFEQDKVFVETDDYILILDGVILNRKSLMMDYQVIGAESWADVLLMAYKDKGERFFSILRGSYSGAIYDKKIDKWVVFGDQIGSKFTYYITKGDFFCVCEEMGLIYQILRDNHIDYHLSTENSMLMLTYGFMFDDRTLCHEIHKINPGCYLTRQNGITREHRYYLLNNTPDYNVNEQEAINIVDYYFRQAVTRQFEKDDEYGYKHIVALSGGLDCRMTSFVAHDCGFAHQLNMTFSQSDYWDQILPMRMAAALNHEWIYKALDNGIWLFDVDEVTRTTGGNVIYYGTAHGNSLYKYLNFQNLGLLHSGQIGDVIIGSFITSKEERDCYKLGEGAYSNRYIKYLSDVKPLLDVNKETGLLYYRAFHGANAGLQNLYNYTETLSPFLDLDMLEKTLSIPVKYRQQHYIYKKWILSKYPHAADFEWEKTGRKITARMTTLGGRHIVVADVPCRLYNFALKKIGINKNNNSLKDMNPVEYYLSHNIELYNYLNDYFKYLDIISDTKLRNIINKIQKTGSAVEKLQAISLLSAIKLFFS